MALLNGKVLRLIYRVLNNLSLGLVHKFSNLHKMLFMIRGIVIVLFLFLSY